MKQKWLVITLAVLGFVLLVELTLFLVFFFRAPQIAEQVEPGATSLHISLQMPPGNADWPLNAHIPLTASVQGSRPIHSMDLYINNVLYESIVFPESSTAAATGKTWNWQPGTAGQFIIIAYAADSAGVTGISQPLVINAVDAASTLSPVEFEPGQTLADLAGDHGISIENIVLANPDLDPAAALGEDQSVYLPNPEDPVTNPNIIPGFDPPKFEMIAAPDLVVEALPWIELVEPAGEPEADGDGEPAGEPEADGDGESPPPFSQMDNFKFWFAQQLADLGSPDNPPPPGGDEPADDPQPGSVPAEDEVPDYASYPPNPPKTYADFKECDVTVKFNAGNFKDPSDPSFIGANEDGFFLYRSRDGGPYERIATWPKIVTEADAVVHNNGFVDAGQFGTLTYYTASFSEEVEVPGNSVTVPLDGINCKGHTRAGGFQPQAHLDDQGNLVLPFSMDLAYFYIQRIIEDTRTQAWRVPEGSRTFLPESGVKLNLFTYLDTVPGLREAPDLVLELQLWGWAGGKLVHAGDFKISLHRSLLLICSVEGAGGCTGNGGGQWQQEIYMSNTKPVSEQAYEVKWLTTNLSPVKDVCFQLGAGPYPDENFWHVNLPITSYCLDGKSGKYEDVFLYEVGKILYPKGAKTAGQWGNGIHSFEYDSNWFQYDVGIGEPFTLYMRVYPRHEMSGLNRYANIAAMHYNTQPLPSEMPPLASNLSSIYTIEILEDTYVPPNFEIFAEWGCVIVEEDPTGKYAVGQKVCPPKISDSKGDCEGMTELECVATGTVNTFATIYDEILWGWELIKTEAAKLISMTIPWCADSPACVEFNKTVLEYVIQYYTGIPANPPASDELIADSAAEFIVSSAIELEKYYTGQDYSAIEVLCEIKDCEKEISDLIKSEMKKQRSAASQPACTSSYQAYFKGKQAFCLDPSIIVHPAPGGSNFPGMVAIRVTRSTSLASVAVNEADADKYLVDISVMAENVYNNDTVTGPLFQTTRLKIPWIAPGDSFVMTTALQICANPGLPGCGGTTNYYGYEPLYFGASAHMKAVEICYSTGSSWDWVPCTAGSSDTWDFTNPSDKSNLEVGQP